MAAKHMPHCTTTPSLQGPSRLHTDMAYPAARAAEVALPGGIRRRLFAWVAGLA